MTIASQSDTSNKFDTLVGELTVEKMLRYMTELKLPSSVSAEECEALVVEVILRCSNLESCRYIIIRSTLYRRKISSGQAKCVDIGIALITRPPILFSWMNQRRLDLIFV